MTRISDIYPKRKDTHKLREPANLSVRKINGSFRDQKLEDIKLETYIKEWTLTEIERENLTYFFLRNWNGAELADRISFSGNDLTLPVIEIWKRKFIPVWQGRPEVWEKIQYLAARGRDYLDPVNNHSPEYWLSFRSGVCERELFAYVLIQESHSGRIEK